MLRIVRLIVALSFLGASGALPAHAEDAASAQKFYVLIYSVGPAWKTGVPMDGQGLRPHFFYWKSMRDAHKLFEAGPLDANGGLILLRAKSLDDAKDIMAHDPAIMGGIFAGEAHTWRAAVDSGKTASDFLAAPE